MTILVSAVSLLMGTVLGAAHFRLVAMDAALALGRGSPLRLAGIRIGRFLATAGFLGLAALAGALPLIAATAGFIAARTWTISRLGPQP
ncbi:MAG TPA: ATP synthase subunit I [Dongiaceae bacterium]|jgi:hypothetical protein|nr:ATP synthase subunit I [Dongiaceae bacterium]